MISKRSLLIFIITVKSLLFIAFLLKDNPHYIQGFWGPSSFSDELTYLDPIDTLILKGEYQPDWRMPGYGVVYLPFRLFLQRPEAGNVVIFIQLIIDILSTYLLGVIAFKIFKSRFALLATIILYAVSFSITIYDVSLATESLTVSFIILSAYFLLKSRETKNA